MTRQFEGEMQELERKLLSLFGVVEKMIDDAMRSICEHEVSLIKSVIATDQKVNETEVGIEEDCLKILALHQPVAINLRRIATVMKINSDLERIADLACNICERAECLANYPFFPIPQPLPTMVKRATEMVRIALDSFVELDRRMAEDVIHRDAEVDQDNRIIIDELRHLMQSDSSLIEPSLHCFSVTRHIERIADHAENIAEDVIYLIDGIIIRHKHEKIHPPAKTSE